MTWYTENGWPACGPDQLDRTPIPGTDIVVPLQRGIPSTILKAFAAALNQFVESAYNSRGGSDEGGWTGTNSVPTSNHLGGTAFDYNWSDHPMGPEAGDPRAGWKGSSIIPGDQVPAVRDLLSFFTYKGVQLVWWGNDWNSPKDSMHFQMGYSTFEKQSLCLEFISKFVTPDGFSTYKRGGQIIAPPVPTPPGIGKAALDILSQAMAPTGVTRSRMEALLPGIVRAYKAIDAGTVDRRAMFNAQIGTESGGLKWTEEIADGSAYEGRTDLGNTRPGDGPRYKGRDVIQVTGRHNYAELSSWAHANGFVDSPSFFVDRPEMLATDQYLFLGAVWYWTTQRPLNDAADAHDLERATRYVNGGLHGIDDRRSRYSNNLAMGELLLAIATEDPDLFEEILMLKVSSLSIYANPGEPDIPVVEMVRAIDAHGNHEDYVEKQARLGEPDALFRVARTAAGKGIYGAAPFAVNQAAAVLAEIQELAKGTAA